MCNCNSDTFGCRAGIDGCMCPCHQQLAQDRFNNICNALRNNPDAQKFAFDLLTENLSKDKKDLADANWREENIKPQK